MTKRLFSFACLLFATTSILPSVAFSALTQDPTLHWRTLYTDHFEIHFHDGERKLAHEVADISERVHNKLSNKFNWTPVTRTQILLTDRFDFSNGLAYPMPRNWMQLIVSAPDSFSSLGDYNNWLELLITHEYTHVLHFDKVAGLPKALRNVFGRFIFLFPNLIQPPWLVEGLATYEETDNQYNTGRGQNSFYRMMMRMEVENGIKPLSQINQPLASWPMNTSRYLYGVYFYNFISSKYGAKKIQQLVDNYSDNILPLAINHNSKATLGKSLNELWVEFENYLYKEFSPEIKSAREASLTIGKQLTHTGYFNTSPKTTPNGDVYFIQQDMHSEPRLMVIRKDKNKPHTITETHGRYFDIHPTSGVIVAELDAFDNTNILSDLYIIDTNSGSKTKITHGGRYIYASWSPDGKKIIAVHSNLGEHALHLLDKKGKILRKLWQGDNKSVLGPPDWSPSNNQIIFSVWRPDTQWNLEIFDINNRQWNQLTRSDNIETTPHFSVNGEEIFFSADYNGTFNLHRLNLASGNINRLSNVIGGVFSPSPTAEGNKSGIFYTAIGKNGFDLFYLENPSNHPAKINIASNNIKTQSTKNTKNTNSIVKESNLVKSSEDYNALSRLTPTAWYPYLLASKFRNETGINTWGSDPIMRHRYTLTAAYDTTNKWYIGRLDYLYDRWNPTIKFSLSRNAIAYLDNNGDIERFRNQDTLAVEGIWPILTRDRQWLLHTGVVHQTETDKDIRSNLGSLKATNDDISGVALSYNSAHIYPISISPSNGRRTKLIAEDYDLFNSYHSGQVFTLDWQEYFKLDLPKQHVLSARGVVGWGTDSPERFRLGGTRETSVSAQPNSSAFAPTERIFGQREYPLHGYPKGRNDLRGTRMMLIEAEWLFPIALIERGLMSPPVGIHQLYGKLFYNWGETWDADFTVPPLRSGAGAELTADLTLGYWLPIDISVGYAQGYNEGGENQTYIELHTSF